MLRLKSSARFSEGLMEESEGIGKSGAGRIGRNVILGRDGPEHRWNSGRWQRLKKRAIALGIGYNEVRS